MKINDYTSDQSLSTTDKLLGSNENGETKNYTLSQILSFIEGNLSIEVDNIFDSVVFNTSPETEPALSPGVFRWNDTEGTLELRLKGDNVTLQLGQENVLRVVNKSGANLNQADFKAVRVSGAQGNRVGCVLAQANESGNSSTTIGLVTEDILSNQEGFITTYGHVREIDTTGTPFGETWSDGDVVYLSQTVAGALTNMVPETGLKIIVGYVDYAHSEHGKIFVNVTNLTQLEEFVFGDASDVSVSGAINGSSLYFDTNDDTWKNSNIFRFFTTTGAETVLNMIASFLPIYTDNTAAVSGGLVTSQIYKTPTGELRIVIDSGGGEIPD